MKLNYYLVVLVALCLVITSAQKGQKGSRGLPGLRGLRGSKGARGYPGRSGKDGAKGGRGFKGHAGFPGYPGKLGVRGPVGQKGTSGIQGPSGPPGPHLELLLEGQPMMESARGPKGVKGEMGHRGRPGPPGPPGPPGSPDRSSGGTPKKGDKGDPGDDGPPGVDGQIGDPGADGIPGIDGEQGQAGLPTASSTFIHWGKSKCSFTSTTLFSGVGVAVHKKDPLCVPTYGIHNKHIDVQLKLHLEPHLDVVPPEIILNRIGCVHSNGEVRYLQCARCFANYKSVVMVFPSVKSCPTNDDKWILEYTGKLMTSTTAGVDYLCVDIGEEPPEGDSPVAPTVYDLSPVISSCFGEQCKLDNIPDILHHTSCAVCSKAFNEEI